MNVFQDFFKLLDPRVPRVPFKILVVVALLGRLLVSDNSSPCLAWSSSRFGKFACFLFHFLGVSPFVTLRFFACFVLFVCFVCFVLFVRFVCFVLGFGKFESSVTLKPKP